MKYTLRILFFLFCTGISMATYAQSTGNNISGDNQIDLGISESNQVNANVGGVDLKFCNSNNLYKNKNNLTLEVEPGETQDICMDFKNDFSYDVDMKVNFIDGGMTNDLVNPRRSCQNEDSKEYFGQYIEDNESMVHIPAGKTLRIVKKMTLPEEQIGYNYGCITYSIPKQTSKIERRTGLGYDVLIRKAGIIDVKVSGDVQSALSLINYNTQSADTTGDIIRGPLLIDEYENYLDVYTSIKNTGTVPQKVKGVGIIKDMFGRKIILHGADVMLLPNEEKTIHLSAPKERRWYFNYFGQQPSISWYRGFYNAYVNLTYTPNLPQGTDPSLIGGSYTLGAKIFLVPWWILVLIGLLSLRIIYATVKKRKKKKIQQELNTQAPL